MASPSDDRSSRLKFWFVISTPLLCGAVIAVGTAAGDSEWFLAGIGVLCSMLYFAAFMFAGEPLGPSRRVLIHWQRQNLGRVRRFFGPGIVPTSSLLVL